jgi:putative FmdB family regulatory protein
VPIYEYRCANGHEFEVFQNMTDDPVSECEVCGESVSRVFSPVAVHYKGSGFYTTDYARKGKKSESKSSGGDSGGGSSGGESKSSEDSSSKSSEKPKSASKD